MGWTAYVFGFPLLGLGALVLLGNLACLVEARVRRTSCSFGLVVGGVCGFAGCAFLPPLGWKVGLVAVALEPMFFGYMWLAIARMGRRFTRPRAP